MKFEHTQVFNFDGALRGMRNPEHTQVFNFDGALRGMRNPLESWDKSDSYINNDEFIIGPNDLQLAQRLINAGSEHRKFMRQIFVSVDITAPLYWWKEGDTYGVGVAKNSTSTMHKIMSKEIDYKMFEMDDFDDDIEVEGFKQVIDLCNYYRNQYLEHKQYEPDLAKIYWKALIRILPEGWLQKRTVTMNYENLYSMVRQRKGHKLTEWNSFINWAKTLPHAEELIFYGGVENS